MPTHAIIKTSQPELVAVYQQKVPLTDAEIKALPTTYIQLVAAPGAGKMLVLISATLEFNFGAGDYADIDAESTLQVVYGDRVADASSVTDMSSNSNNSFCVLVPAQQTGIFSSLLYGPKIDIQENVPLKLIADNPADFTGGNAANTLKVTVCYSIVDL